MGISAFLSAIASWPLAASHRLADDTVGEPEKVSVGDQTFRSIKILISKLVPDLPDEFLDVLVVD